MSDPGVNLCAQCRNSYMQGVENNTQCVLYCSYYSCKDPVQGFDQPCVFNRSLVGACLPEGIYFDHGYPP